MSKTPTKGKAAKPAVLTFANPDEAQTAPLNFRVPAQFHREFKLFAVEHGISMVDLLQQSFQLMKSQRKR